MAVTKNIGMLLLGIWLVVTGLMQLFVMGAIGVGTITALLAAAAGVFILIGK